MQKPSTIDEYIAGFPQATQVLLEQLRQAIQKAAPEATETIKYAMPTFVLHGNLVYFAAYPNHIGFYAMSSTNLQFKEQLAPYKTGKGSIQFPINAPLPLDLIREIVLFRIKENIAKKTLKQ